jgi:hypothetical protein
MDRYEFCRALARDAGKLAHRAFDTSAMMMKGRQDVVTAMDREVERFVYGLKFAPGCLCPISCLPSTSEFHPRPRLYRAGGENNNRLRVAAPVTPSCFLPHVVIFAPPGS